MTFDLDAAGKLEKTLKSLQLEKGKHYIPVGVELAGKRNIEGLLPDSVTTAVYGANPGLVQAATSGDKDEADSAKNRLKKLLLEEFKKKAKPGTEYFGGFYPLVKLINKASRDACPGRGGVIVFDLLRWLRTIPSQILPTNDRPQGFTPSCQNKNE